MENSQIITKYCTTVSQNSPKIGLFKMMFRTKVWICELTELLKSAKKLGPANRKSTNIKPANYTRGWVRKSQIRKVQHLRKLRKSNK